MIEAKKVGKEQLILLPITNTVFTLTTEPPEEVKLSTGRHAVVVSGYAGIFTDGASDPGFILWIDDDETVKEHEVEFLAGPLWADVSQVSASIWPAGILSMDADDVDQSTWELVECTWKVVNGGQGERIKLRAKFRTSGEQNGWSFLGYQFVATGTLVRLPTVEEISADFE
jgi:hypothetical protein